MILLAPIFVAAAIFVGSLFRPLVGMACGWVLSVMMPMTMVAGFAAFGLNISADALPAIGAVLGFVSGFFSASGGSEK